MTNEEKELITMPDDRFYKIADEYEEMAGKCSTDIKDILGHFFPDEDSRLIEAIAMLISSRYNDDVLILVEKFKTAVLETLKNGIV